VCFSFKCCIICFPGAGVIWSVCLYQTRGVLEFVLSKIGHRIHGTTEPRNHGSTGQGIYGSGDLRNYGTTELRNYGTTDLWNNGTTDLPRRSLVHWLYSDRCM
jgi:hypothetical protein